MNAEKDVTDKELKHLISQKLKQLRKKSGKTLEETAQDLDLDYSIFYNLYNGRRLPRLTTLVKLSRRYGLPVEYWFKDLARMPPKNTTWVERRAVEFNLLKNFNRLDKQTRKVMSRILQKLGKGRG
jgi:transcriptional regulator with XRE-family HTH domain